MSREITQIHDVIERLRLEMGKPPVAEPDVTVRMVSYRELYYLAKSLFTKTNNLYFEWTRQRHALPGAQGQDITERDVTELVSLSKNLLAKVGAVIGETLDEAPVAPAGGENTDELFCHLVSANRRVNGLLTVEVIPGNVYEKVSQGVKYASELLRQFPGAERIPDEPPLERRKRPADVHARLLGCLSVIGDIKKDIGLRYVVIERFDFKNDDVQPGDVYDLASVVMSELDHLYARTGGGKTLRPIYYPGMKTPSQVFRRVGLLEAQLMSLKSRIASDPSRMKLGAK